MIPKDTSLKDFISSIIMCAILLLISGIICWLYNSVHDTKNWNDGHCECGGNWIYEQAIGHQYSTNYIYYCDKCGTTIEINEKR